MSPRRRCSGTAALLTLFLGLGVVLPDLDATEDGWVSLFDGQSLAGWKAAESPASFRVVDGAIACDGPRAHLFYVGSDGQAAFENFEVAVEVEDAPRRQLGLLLPHRVPGAGLPGAGLRGAGRQHPGAPR